MKYILAIQEAHDASAALMVDGVLVAAAQEERFTGLKGDYGFPRHAVAHCLARAGIAAAQLDVVALASNAWNPVLTKIKRNANFSVDDWVKEQREFWKPTLLEKKKVRYYDLYKDRPDWSYDTTYPMEHLLDGYMNPAEMADMRRLRLSSVASILGVPLERVRTITHEDCHTFYAYFGSPLRGLALGLTSEGIGDFSNGTVNRFSEAGCELLAHTKENHLGHIYQYVTLLLGMKPTQHEYKVMGLAPYANSHEQRKSYKVFEHVLKVSGLNIVYDQKPDDLYFWFRDRLEGHRFDGIAGAAQLMVEKLLCEWTQACIRHTGLRRVVFAGGVSQNIKAAKCMGELPEVDELYVCPAAGDTSLPMGACYYVMWEYLKQQGRSMDVIKPLTDIYLGPSFSNDQIAEVLGREKVAERYTVKRGVTPAQIADLLASGQVIARCSGGMEFGLRALGNRSILADPRDPMTVTKINAKIKFRDFWMPFTPSILAERATDYLINPKNLQSPYMTLAFDSTAKGRKDLPAAMHPADYTIRPQVLQEAANPAYYELIKAFERKTGVGGLLNTSFNLHGDPIVLGPQEAIYTMDNSELDGVLLEDYLVLRK